MFPHRLTPTKELQVSTVYNLVLPAGHIVDIDGVLACTLGHGIKGNRIIEHEFFGTQAVIDAGGSFGSLKGNLDAMTSWLQHVREQLNKK